MRGAPFAIDSAPGMAPLAEALAVELGGNPFPVPGPARVAYHAALSHAANHTVTLVAQAIDLLVAQGVEDPAAALGPLVRAALENGLSGGVSALTGPISRGDSATLAAHLAAFEAHAAGGTEDEAPSRRAAVRSYQELARATVGRALALGRITPAQAAACEAALSAGADPARDEGVAREAAPAREDDLVRGVTPPGANASAAGASLSGAEALPGGAVAPRPAAAPGAGALTGEAGD
jgi:hypothetical protein